MTIERFKELTLAEKLDQLRHSGELLGSYDRNSEQNGPKVPGDIFALYDTVIEPFGAKRYGRMQH